MINAVYRLTAPRSIDVTHRELFLAGKTIVRPAFLSICRADQRYYQGQRPQETLAKKLPMALIHECVGTVVYDATGSFTPGALVVPVPNLPAQGDAVIAENYRPGSTFASSGKDGFLREYIDYPPELLITVPDLPDLHIASFLELMSVSMHAIRRFECFSHSRRDAITVWGDGNLGFITALFLRYLFPKTHLTVVGAVPAKLSYFTFADETLTTWELPASFCTDHAFECVGGSGAQQALVQMTACVRPEGTLALMGVSENPCALPTRLVLEKGLRLFGSSRSGVKDFQETISLLSEYPALLPYLENSIGEVRTVRSIADIHAAFEADLRRGFGKTVMAWQA